MADMIEGIVVANHLEGARADLARSALWLAVDGDAGPQAPPTTEPTHTVPTAPARPDAAAA